VLQAVPEKRSDKFAYFQILKVMIDTKETVTLFKALAKSLKPPVCQGDGAGTVQQVILNLSDVL